MILARALPRFLEVFDRFWHSLDAVCGRQRCARWMAGRPLLRKAAQLSHELGNHSFSHPYALSRLSPQDIESELAACGQVLDEAAFAKTVRAVSRAGYELSVPLLQSLLSAGYRYDSSVFPCPPYYLLKLSVLGLLALRGQQSASIGVRPGSSLRRPSRIVRRRTIRTDPAMQNCRTARRCDPGLAAAGDQDVSAFV